MRKISRSKVNIYNQGNHIYRELHERYGVSPPTLSQWVTRYNNTNSFSAKDNRTDEENKVIELEKKIKQLEMENDILKQAAIDNLSGMREAGDSIALLYHATGERVIIVTGCINALRSRVSGTLVNMIHALLRVIKYNYCKQCMRSKDVLALQY